MVLKLKHVMKLCLGIALSYTVYISLQMRARPCNAVPPLAVQTT